MVCKDSGSGDKEEKILIIAYCSHHLLIEIAAFQRHFKYLREWLSSIWANFSHLEKTVVSLPQSLYRTFIPEIKAVQSSAQTSKVLKMCGLVQAHAGPDPWNCQVSGC